MPAFGSGGDEDITFPDLVSIVYATKSCEMRLTEEAAATLFRKVATG